MDDSIERLMTDLTVMHVVKVFVMCLFIISDAHGDTRTINRCMEDLSKSFTVQLQCPVGEWIHVVHEAYGDRDTVTCRLKSTDSCNKLQATSQHGLIVNCNGKESCSEAMSVQSINNCNITDAAAEVKYNCIKGSLNMCSPVTTTVNGSVYLHSPGFPDSVGVNSSCVVRITGQSLQVTLVEQRTRSGKLNISGDGRQLGTKVNANQHNRVLPGSAAEIVIFYDNHDQNGSNLWIRVADSGQMSVTITSEIRDASTTSTSTPQPSRSQSTPSPSSSDTPTTKTTSTHSTAFVAASFTTATSTHSTGNNATQRPSTSTAMISTTDTGQSAMSETVTGDPTDTTASVTTPKPTTGQSTVSGTLTADPRTSTTTAVTTPKATTIITTSMTTNDGEASSSTTSSSRSETGLIVWAASAISGCVVTILVVVIAVVLCRKRVKENRPLETPGKVYFERHLELSPTNTEKHYNGFGQNSTCNQHSVLDQEFVGGSGQPINIEPGHRSVTPGRNEEVQYTKAEPLGSTVDMYDKSTNSKADIGEGMVDNVVYDKFCTESEKESVHDESYTSPTNSKQALINNCEMIENDVYDGGLPYATNDNDVGDLYDGGLETSEGMVDNRLYDKSDFDREKGSLKDESNVSPNISKLAWKDDCDMVENDVYQRGPPHFDDPAGSGADNKSQVGYLYDGELGTSDGMVDNGLCDKFECDREKESLPYESDTSARNKWKNDCDMVENDVYERGPP